MNPVSGGQPHPRRLGSASDPHGVRELTHGPSQSGDTPEAAGGLAGPRGGAAPQVCAEEVAVVTEASGRSWGHSMCFPNEGTEAQGERGPAGQHGGAPGLAPRLGLGPTGGQHHREPL